MLLNSFDLESDRELDKIRIKSSERVVSLTLIDYSRTYIGICLYLVVSLYEFIV